MLGDNFANPADNNDSARSSGPKVLHPLLWVNSTETPPNIYGSAVNPPDGPTNTDLLDIEAEEDPRPKARKAPTADKTD